MYKSGAHPWLCVWDYRSRYAKAAERTQQRLQLPFFPGIRASSGAKLAFVFLCYDIHTNTNTHTLISLTPQMHTHTNKRTFPPTTIVEDQAVIFEESSILYLLCDSPYEQYRKSQHQLSVFYFLTSAVSMLFHWSHTPPGQTLPSSALRFVGPDVFVTSGWWEIYWPSFGVWDIGCSGHMCLTLVRMNLYSAGIILFHVCAEFPAAAQRMHILCENIQLLGWTLRE